MITSIETASDLAQLIIDEPDEITLSVSITHDETNCTAVMHIFRESDTSVDLYQRTMKVKRTFENDLLQFEAAEKSDELADVILAEINDDNNGFQSFSDQDVERLRRGENLDRYSYYFGFYAFDPYKAIE